LRLERPLKGAHPAAESKSLRSFLASSRPANWRVRARKKKQVRVRAI
jgi:hypothetical protein